MPTVKCDWLNDLLAEEGWLVSSHSSFASQLDMVNVDVSVRFIGNRSIGYQLLMVILLDDVESSISRLQNNIKLIELFDSLTKASSHEMFIIFFGKDCCYAGDSIKELNKYYLDNLCSFFEQINPAYTKNTGNVKAENQSINDSFQSWTRSNLSGFLTINDFDSLCLKEKDSSLHVLELKRVQEEPEEWCPYLDDFSNYYACQKISGRKFRVIVYNELSITKVAVFKFDEIEKHKFVGRRWVVSTSSCGPITTEKLYLCREGFKTFESQNRRKPKYISKCNLKDFS